MDSGGNLGLIERILSAVPVEPYRWRLPGSTDLWSLWHGAADKPVRAPWGVSLARTCSKPVLSLRPIRRERTRLFPLIAFLEASLCSGDVSAVPRAATPDIIVSSVSVRRRASCTTAALGFECYFVGCSYELLCERFLPARCRPSISFPYVASFAAADCLTALTRRWISTNLG